MGERARKSMSVARNVAGLAVDICIRWPKMVWLSRKALDKN